MSKSKILPLAAVLATLVLVSAWMAWRDMRAFGEFTRFFERVSMVMEESAGENEVAKDANYRAGVEALNSEIAGRMERIYNAHAKGDANLNTAVALTRGLFEDLFRLRSDFAAAVEPFLSARMHDRRTVKDKASYEWRIGVLDGIGRHTAGHRAEIERILEDFRQSVAGSGLPEKYKRFVWQDWARDLDDRLGGLGPETEHFQGEIADYRRLFDYLYENSYAYYVGEDGKVVITDDWHLKDYQSIAKAVGQGW